MGDLPCPIHSLVDQLGRRYVRPRAANPCRPHVRRARGDALSTTTRDILFVVSGGTQWQDALAIADRLPQRCRVLDLADLTVLEPPPPGGSYAGPHWAPQGIRRVLQLRRMVQPLLATVGVVVVGQDAGRLQRAVIAAARVTNVPVAVVPDGALFDAPAAEPPVVRAQDALLRALRLLAGEPLRFGATHPDLWCAWGEGWVPMLEQFSPDGAVAVTGSPRAASLASVPPPQQTGPRVLVCSQPTWVHPFPQSATAGPTWYRWLDRFVRSAGGRARVRLHPRERELLPTLDLSDAVLDARTAGRTLADDLGAADVVVAPFSTVLIESAAAGRQVVSVVPDHGCAAVRQSSPAMADDRLPVLTVDEVDDIDALQSALPDRDAISAWGRDFAVVSPDNADRCADALATLVAAKR